MMGHLLTLALIGAAAGWAATRLMAVRLSPLATVAVGALGALVAGFALKVVLPLALSLIGAVAAACLLIWLADRHGLRLR